MDPLRTVGRGLLIAIVALATGAATGTPIDAQTADAQGGDGAEIVGGVEARSGDFPHQVGLLTRGVSNRWDAQFCGGSIISPTAVLTAAHCVEGETAATIDVLAGTIDLSGTAGQRVPATAIHTHPQWNPGTTAFDTAIVEVGTPLSGDPVRVVQPGHESLFRARTTVTISGWGAVQWYGPYPTRLRKVSVPVASDGACSTTWGSAYRASSMLCAGYSQGGKDACFGDSGGPVATRAGSNWVLVGVVSWGPELCAAPGTRGVSARVSAMSAFIGPYLMARDHPFYDIAPWLEPAIIWIFDDGLMAGYPDGTFGPSRNLTRAQAVRLLWRLQGSPAVGTWHGFSDVPAWVDGAVRWAAKDPDGAGPGQPVVSGFPNGTFRPDASITRGEWTRMQHRIAGEAAASVPHSFSDVPTWLTDAVSWIADPVRDPQYAEGFPDGTYGPNLPINRGQTTRMAFRIYGP